jgi:hypothetical protein
MHDRRAEQAFADDAHAAGTAGARVLLVEDDLFEQRRAPASELGRPPEADPTVATELLLPFPTFVEQFVFVARAAASAHLREVAVETVGQPRARIGAEAFLRRCEVQVHRERAQRSSRTLRGFQAA